MAETNFTPQGSTMGANCFKEAVCINAGRIYDSCSEKEFTRYTHGNTDIPNPPKEYHQ